jgi:PKD repeat protein
MVNLYRVVLALAVLAAGAVAAVSPAEAGRSPAPDGSPSQYQWVDSNQLHCVAPSSSLPSPNPGCPSLYEDLWCCQLGGGYTWAYMDDVYLWQSMPFDFEYYGVKYGPSEPWPNSVVVANTNGFLFLPGEGCDPPQESGDGPWAAADPSSQPQQAPTPSSNESPCVNTNSICCPYPNLAPRNFIAGFWTNMETACFWSWCPYPCPDDPWDQGLYVDVRGTAPNRYLVFEWKNMRVTDPSRQYWAGAIWVNNQPSDQDTFCAQPHSFATFEIKLFEGTNNIDVLFRAADNNNQAVSMGIENSDGSHGLGYLYQPGGVPVSFTDFGLRYYPKHDAMARDAEAYGLEDAVAGITVDAMDPDYEDAEASFAGPRASWDGLASTSVPDTTASANPAAPARALDGNGDPVPREYTYAPPADWNGVDTFRYTATSVDGSTSEPATVTVELAPVNDAPVAVDHLFRTLPGSSLFRPAPGVLDGATDVEISRGETPTQTLSAEIVDPLPPGTGTVLLGADGAIEYEADPSMGEGSETQFTYRVCDDAPDALCSEPATVTLRLEVPNPNLIARDDTQFTLREDTPFMAPAASGVLANDHISPDATGVHLVVVQAPAHAAPGSFGLSPDGSFSYSPEPDWNGVDVFRYRIGSLNDGESNEATVRITVRPVNDMPSFTATAHMPDFFMMEDSATVTLTDFVENIMAGPPTALDEAGQLAPCYLAPPPAPCFRIDVAPADFFTDPPWYSGPAVGRAPGIHLDPANPGTGDLKFRPGRDRFGTATITISMVDGGGTADGGVEAFPAYGSTIVFTLLVDPKPDRPVAVPESYTLLRGHTLARDDANGLLANDWDPDGGELTFVPDSLPGVCGTFTFNDRGGFSYEANVKLTGTAPCIDTFRYHLWHPAEPASFQKSSIVTSSFTVLWNGQPVAAFSPSAREALPRDSIAFTDASYDSDAAPGAPDRGIVSWLWDFADGHTSTARDPVHSFAREGWYRVRLTVTDSMGDTASTSQVVRIVFPPSPQPAAGLADQVGGHPVAYAGGNLEVPEDSEVTLRGRAPPEATPSRPLYFQWSQAGGTPVELVGADTRNATFTAPAISGPEPQTLTFSLVVSDGRRVSAPSLVQVTVTSTNLAPMADAGPLQRLPQGEVATLDASRSRDPDGALLSYRWTQVGGPPVKLEGADRAQATFTVPELEQPAPLAFEVAVSDGEVESTATTQVLVLPRAEMPTGFTYRTEPAAGGAKVTFQPLAKGTSYVWDFGDGSAGSSDTSPSHVYAKAGPYQVRLTVVGLDGEATLHQKQVTVTALEASSPPQPQDAARAQAGALPGWAAAGIALGAALLAGAVILIVAMARRRA